MGRGEGRRGGWGKRGLTKVDVKPIKAGEDATDGMTVVTSGGAKRKAPEDRRGA